MEDDELQCVLETKAFLNDAKEAGLTEDERNEIVDKLARDPEVGEKIQGAGGARKVRFKLGSKGKSGGVRVITFFSGRDIPVFLLSLFKKGERIDLTQAERNSLASWQGT